MSTTPNESVPRQIIAALIALIGLAPVLWFYAEIDVAYWWNYWESQGRPRRNLKMVLLLPFAVYLAFFIFLAKWSNGKAK